MKSMVRGVAVTVFGCVALMMGCEKAPSSSPAPQAATPPVPQTAATSEPAKPAPASTPASAPANPIADPKATPPAPDASNLPPSLGTATLENGVMTVAGVMMKVPDAWEKADTGNATIRPAMKFNIAAPAGTSIEAGSVGVFSGIKGTPEQNLARWLAQVNNLEGKPEKEQFQQNGLTLTRLVAVGMYNPGMGVTGGQPKENWVLYGLVISGGPEGDVQILARGPKEVMLRQRENWDAFMKSAAPEKAIEAPAEETPATDGSKAGG